MKWFFKSPHLVNELCFGVNFIFFLLQQSMYGSSYMNKVNAFCIIVTFLCCAFQRRIFSRKDDSEGGE